MTARDHQEAAPGPDERRERARSSDHSSTGPDRAATGTSAAEAAGSHRAQQILQLQRSAGNRAVASAVAGGRPNPLPVQRWGPDNAPIGDPNRDPSLTMTDKEKVALALESKDKGDVKKIQNFGAATADERMRLVDILVQGWVGPLDETALERIWGTFGDGVFNQAKGNPERWRLSVEGGAELEKLPGLQSVPAKFLGDVRTIAGGFLNANEKTVKEELKKLGVTAEPGQDKKAAEERLASIQKAAELVKKAQAAQVFMGTLEVGEYEYSGYMPGTPATGYQPYYAKEIRPKRFEPGRPPPLPPKPGMQSHETVQKEYDEAQAIIDGLGIAYPAVYALTSTGSHADVAKVAEDKPEAAKGVVVEKLQEVLANIEKTRPKLAGSLAYDLKPIHDQLLGGRVKGASQVDWAAEPAKSLGAEVIQGHEDVQFWVSMGLGTLAAAAFIIAEIGTLGAATPFLVGLGAGIGVGQAAVSIDKAIDITRAAGTGMSKQTELVASGQADAAVFEAVLNSVLAFVDIAGGAKVLAKLGASGVVGPALRAGTTAGRAALEGLERVGSIAAHEAKPLIEKGVAELGVEGVLTRTNKSVDDLLKIVGEDSAVGARLKAFKQLPENIAKLTPRELEARLANLGAEKATDAAVAEALAVAAVERFGPVQTLRKGGGWQAMAMILGNESKAGKSLMAWRDALVNEIDAFVRTLPGGVDETGKAAFKRTGTQGKFSNDFDVSLLGPRASSNRDAVRSFVAGRVGIGVDELNPMLLADFFTDPRRMHLYDQLDPAIRAQIAAKAEKTAEATIMAKALHDAQQAGNKQLVDQLKAMMQKMGIDEAALKPLSSADRAALYKRMDDLHVQLEHAVASGDKAAQSKLALEIGETQGLVNATEGGGYFSGGAVAQIVSKKEGIGAAVELLDAQKYTALLDQLPKFYEQSSALLKSGFVAGEDAVGALKGIGKYGSRFRELMSELGVKTADEAKWNELAGKFTKLMKQAKGEADKTALERLVGEADLLRSEVTQHLADFRASSESVLAALQKQAGLNGPGVDLANIQFLVMAHAKLIRTMDAIKASMFSFATGIGRTAATAAAPGDTPPVQTPTPALAGAGATP